MKVASKTKKKHFSSFTYAEAFKYLSIKNIKPWVMEVAPVEPSDFFVEHLKRIAEVFDLQSCEESKKLVIDAICEEALQSFKHLKIWKGAPLADEHTNGYVDYLLAERKAYLESPFLCIVEAKKDDFEQGLAQCLVEMKACQYGNIQKQYNIDVFGIVTNGDTWKFYRLTTDNQVYGTEAYSKGTMNILLGYLRHILKLCEEHIMDIL
ncbi:MAG: hypothetical protein F6K10_01815 [Moorea sp. SIO2B7]|nr:hypothetical protein [Moorena sp. SIO2B7]